MDNDGASAERKQVAFAQLAHDAIDVNGGEPQGICQNELGERTLELGFAAKSDQAQSLGQLQEEVRCALKSAAPSDVHEVLYDHKGTALRHLPGRAHLVHQLAFADRPQIFRRTIS